MKTIRKVVCIAVLAVAALPSMASAASKWLRADTHNFIIYSNGDEKYLREFAENAERFDATLRMFMQIPADDTPNRLTIYMVRDQANVGRMMRNSEVAGFYRATLEGSYAVSNRTRSEERMALTGTEVLFHEYAHHFMYRHLSAAYPLWFQEGFAEYYSTVTFTKDGRFEVGRPADHRALGLFMGSRVPLKQLLTAQGYSDLKRAQMDPFYGRSWLLTHKLMRTPESRRVLQTYLTDFFSGMPREEAARRSFPDFTVTDKELDQLMSAGFPVTTSNQPVAFQSAITIKPLDAMQSDLIDLRLQYQGWRDVIEARNRLAALGAQYPGQSDVWYNLAAATIKADMFEQWRADRAQKNQKDDAVETAEEDRSFSLDLFDDLTPVSAAARQSAEAALEKAVAANKDNGRAHAFLANLIMTRLEEASTPESDPAWANARTHIIAANKANPEDPVPLVMWYRFQKETKPTPSETARAGLAKAFALAPEVDDVRVMYAFDLAANKDFRKARKILEVIANDAHRGSAGTAALRQLDAMEGKTPSSATTAPTADKQPAS